MKIFGIDFFPSIGMSAETQFAWKALINLDREEEITHYFKKDFPIRTVKEELNRVIEEKVNKLHCLK